MSWLLLWAVRFRCPVLAGSLRPLDLGRNFVRYFHGLLPPTAFFFSFSTFIALETHFFLFSVWICVFSLTPTVCLKTTPPWSLTLCSFGSSRKVWPKTFFWVSDESTKSVVFDVTTSEFSFQSLPWSASVTVPAVALSKDVFAEISLSTRTPLRNKGELFLKTFEFVLDFFDGFGLSLETSPLSKLSRFLFPLLWDTSTRWVSSLLLFMFTRTGALDNTVAGPVVEITSANLEQLTLALTFSPYLRARLPPLLDFLFDITFEASLSPFVSPAFLTESGGKTSFDVIGLNLVMG